MSLQARFSQQDPRLYSTDRDLAHNAKGIMQEVAARLEDGVWDTVDGLLKAAKVTDSQVGEACAAYCRYLVSATENPKETMAQCLARCGWFDCHPLCRVAIMATLGTVIAGYQFAGLREATLGGVGPVQDLWSLRWEGRRCSLLMRMGRWRRFLYKWKGRLARAWRSFRTGNG